MSDQLKIDGHLVKMSSNALACICNVINPCRNEVSTTFVVVQWLITGFAALAQVVRPVLLLCKFILKYRKTLYLRPFLIVLQLAYVARWL